MIVATAAPEWTCGRCRLTVSYMPGRPVPTLPPGWSEDAGDGHRCLRCRREIAGEEALRAAGVGPADVDADAIRKAAVVRFEIARDPGRGPKAIARSAGCSTPTLAKVRREMAAEAAAGPDDAGGGS